jgi:hypothetical protein
MHSLEEVEHAESVTGTTGFFPDGKYLKKTILKRKYKEQAP